MEFCFLQLVVNGHPQGHPSSAFSLAHFFMSDAVRPPEPSLLSLFSRLNKPSSLITPRIACGQVPAQTM